MSGYPVSGYGMENVKLGRRMLDGEIPNVVSKLGTEEYSRDASLWLRHRRYIKGISGSRRISCHQEE